MRDTAKGRKQGRKLDQPEKEVWLAAADFAKLIGITGTFPYPGQFKRLRTPILSPARPGSPPAFVNPR